MLFGNEMKSTYLWNVFSRTRLRSEQNIVGNVHSFVNASGSMCVPHLVNTSLHILLCVLKSLQSVESENDARLRVEGNCTVMDAIW